VLSDLEQFALLQRLGHGGLGKDDAQSKTLR